MILEIPLGILGIVLFLFLYWRRLKDDYVANHIFTSALIIVLSLFFGLFIASFVVPLWWFWIALVSLVCGILVSVKKFRMRVNEVADAVFMAVLPLYMFSFFAYFGSTRDFRGVIGSLCVLFIFIAFFVFDANYKQLSWYKSGKIGFSSLASMGILLFMRALVAFLFGNMVSFVGGYEIYLSGIFSIVSFGTLAYLSRNV